MHIYALKYLQKSIIACADMIVKLSNKMLMDTIIMINAIYLQTMLFKITKRKSNYTRTNFVLHWILFAH